MKKWRQARLVNHLIYLYEIEFILYYDNIHSLHLQAIRYIILLGYIGWSR